jgi:NADPH-dependent glutamate synthase beta subunit-like oxidoreductase
MHPCESNCRRAELNEPIAICALKRYASEKDKGLWKNEVEKTPEKTGKKIAIIGSGPAGMTAAFYTAKAGHSVTVFESSNTPGGMLTHTIPLYRLPRAVFDEDLQEIMEAGDIEIRTGSALGKDFSIPELQSGGYEAIFISIGLQGSRKIDIEGIDAENVVWGIDFLKQVRTGERTGIGKDVIVVGGGNVAIDVARTARRLGAGSVRMLCLETREEMPAHSWEVTAAEQEGVEVLCSWGPMKIITENGFITGVDFKKCTCVFDPAGKFCPEYDESNTTRIEGDTVILAIGQTADISMIDDNTMEILNDANMIRIDMNTLHTDMENVWAGGDIVRMPGTVIDAIQMGRIAAGEINKHLGGSGDINEVLVPFEEPSKKLGLEEDFFNLSRYKMKCIDDSNRTGSFDEVELTYEESVAQAEASRCLQCDLRLTFGSNPLPPELYIEFTDVNIQNIPEAEGVVQILDENKEILAIKGSMNMRQELEDRLNSMDKAKFFIYEEDQMYSQRENELLSQYMQKHGKMPGADDDDDDLF